MGCTDDMWQDKNQLTGTPVRFEPMKKMDAAKDYGLWLEIRDEYNCRQKLVQIKSTTARYPVNDGYFSVQCFDFICVDLAGFEMTGTMVAQSNHKSQTLRSHVDAWGEDIPVRYST